VNSFRSLARLGLLALLPAALAAQKPRAQKSRAKSLTAAKPAPAPAPLPLKYDAKPTGAAITTGDLMSRLYVFADDSMMGREAGTIGHMMGTQYIADEAQRLGLVPAGDNGTFFQDVPFISRRFSSGSTLLTVENGALGGGSDIMALPFRGAAARPLDGVSAIYGGTQGDTANALTAEQVAGKLVVLTLPANGSTRIGPSLAGAAGVAFVVGPRLTPQQIQQGRGSTLTLRPAPDAAGVATPMYVTDRAAQLLMGAPLAGLPVGTVGRTVHGNLKFSIDDAPTRNVVAILPGTDKKLREQFVAIGAHSDHVGYRAAGWVDHDSLHAWNRLRWLATENPSGARLTAEQQAQQRERLANIQVNLDSMHGAQLIRPDSINNGADDDGSGSVTVLEVAEAFAKGKARPKRSILFVWHTGEEKGLLGSRYFADHPTIPRDSIVAQINIDMVGRGAATDLAAGGPRYLQLVGSRRLSTELGDLTEAVNKKQRLPFVFDYAYDANGHPDNIYCRSDHYNYARYGIPVVFMTTGLHGDYHQVTDEPQYIDYPHMARIGQFVYDLANRVATLDHRPVVDKEKPDPMGSCRQ
jgi:hypothetical protein